MLTALDPLPTGAFTTQFVGQDVAPFIFASLSNLQEQV
jgi:hypothetical protein